MQNLIFFPGTSRVECPHTSTTLGGSHDAPLDRAPPHSRPPGGAARRRRAAGDQSDRIGYLIAGSSPAGPDPRLHDFRQGLRDLGYVEGQNLLIEPRYAEGSDARLRAFAAELVRLPVEVIVAGGSAATRAAQQATRTIPIVMASSGNPVGLGFVASLARPGRNITGVSNFVAELPGKQLELLKEAVPQSTRIAVLTNPAAPSHGPEMENLAVAAKGLGVHVHVVPLRSRDELAGAFAAMTREGAKALVVL